MDIYVGNLSPDVGKNDLIEIFDKFGEVTEVRVIKDKFRGKFKGFAFIQMPSEEQAKKAIEEINGQELNERALTVSEAKPKAQRRRKSRKKARKRKKPGIYGGENRDNFGIRRRGKTGKRY
ncbi:MAG: RNA-binding protein [Phycisphaerae bacterium]|nr:RNA-binding protein [Phycisphaerae bacterium]NIP52564.1 RNA-binding protein [Phycisphaerae bacterium]NIS51548.1 RNA-binding protein [Phycisphaerae bacterium]NIU09130.1 RNA-binding protein [Phycisphaerae bacterium]NIU59630.1 RNA-binding protein [Phycisphaerae bacterium]